MGASGTGLFDDDVAAEVRGEWEKSLAEGHSPRAATDTVIQELGADIRENPDDGPVFWLALAAIQLDAAALDADVGRHALEPIGPNLERWREEASPEDAAARERALNELRSRLSAA